MRNINFANIVYFSGTGGTELAAMTLNKELRLRGVETRIKAISIDDKSEYTQSDILFLLYPVHAGDASEAVYNFISNLPNMPIPLTDCVILSVSAGGEAILNTACRSKIIRRLLKKGYKTVCEDMIVMPNNFASAFSDKLGGMLVYSLPIKIRDIINKVMNGIMVRKNPHLIDSILRTLCEPFKLGAKLNGKCLKADNTLCTGCGLCAEKCPRGNITITEGKPIFGWKCVMCMRCVYLCPNAAIKSSFMKIIKIKEGFDINKYMNSALKIIELKEQDVLDATVEKSNYAVRNYLLEICKLIKSEPLLLKEKN